MYTTNIPTLVRRSIEDKANITHQNHNDNDGDQNTGHRSHYMLFLYRRVSLLRARCHTWASTDSSGDKGRRAACVAPREHGRCLTRMNSLAPWSDRKKAEAHRVLRGHHLTTHHHRHPSNHPTSPMRCACGKILGNTLPMLGMLGNVPCRAFRIWVNGYLTPARYVWRGTRRARHNERLLHHTPIHPTSIM